MIYLWITLGVLAALVMVPNIIGLLLPERHEGQLKVVFQRSPEEVWTALANVEAHPMTGKMMKSVERRPEEHGMAVWVEDMGRGELITVKTTESKPFTRLVREMTSASAPMTSRWEYELADVKTGCEVSLSGVTFIRGGSWISPFFRFMMLVGGGVRKGLQIQMDMVAKSLGVVPEYKNI